MQLKTEKEVKSILGKYLGLEESELQDNTAFAEDLNTDPLVLEDALRKLYEKFGIKEERQDFETVGEVINFIRDQLDEIEE